MSNKPNKDFKLNIQPEVIDLVSESESESDNIEPEVIDLVSEEEEFLPMFGPLPEPHQGPIPMPYQGPYGNWIYPAGYPNMIFGVLPQIPAQPQMQDNSDDDDWSDEYQLADLSEDSEEELDQPAPPAQPTHDEGYPVIDADFVEENVGHEVISESSDSGRNSENDL